MAAGTEVIRHEPVDVAYRASEAAVLHRGGYILTRFIFCHGHPGEADGGVMYRIWADGSVETLNNGCEAVIEDGMIIGYRHLEEAAHAQP